MSTPEVTPAPNAAPQTDLGGIRQDALDAAREGLSVFPLLPRRKEPLIEGWPDRATTDEAQLNRWFDERPDANYAILANEDVCFIDTDPRNGAVETLARLEAEEPEFASLLKTRTVETGRRDGGRHFYFRPPKAGSSARGKTRLGQASM
jgi:Bifunctional DNA primase/polymerase, N-terminal